MTEGLMKNTSLTAMALAAGMVLSIGSGFAADLGGNCCADLEERIAELEATTARKGTRKTSLEVWGSINKMIVAWDDGINKNTALGIDNVNYSTRFGFRGNAKIRSDITAGYSIVVEQATGGRSTNLSQFADKAPGSGISTTATNFKSEFSTNDTAITMREGNWWLESNHLGRVTVGRFVGGAGPQGTIDLAGIGLTAASGSFSLIGTGFNFRTNQPVVNPSTPGSANSGAAPSSSFTNYNIGNVTDGAGEYSTRQNGVMWASPVLAGFTLTASLAGSIEKDGIATNAAGTATAGYGPLWSVGLKYANEFNGVRVAAAYGHEDAVDSNYTSLISTNGTSIRPHSTNDGVSLSLMHVATGLFGQGFYNEYTRGHDLFTAAGAPSAYSLAGNTKDTAKQWLIQGGVVRNWFGYGNTALYAEYGRTDNGFNAIGLERAGSAFYSATLGGVAYTGDVTKQRVWGLGVVQNIDAAAMELYSGYRNFSLSSDNCALAGGCKDIGMFVSGARIKF